MPRTARQRLGSPAFGQGRAALLVELCDTLVNGGECASARDIGEHAVELARECGDSRLAHWPLQSLTFACGRLGDQAMMDSLPAQLMSSARALGQPRLLAEALSHLSWNLTLRGLLDEAEAAVEEGLAALAGDPASAVLSDLLHTAGAIALQRGDVDRAAAHFTVVLTVDCDIALVDAVEAWGPWRLFRVGRITQCACWQRAVPRGTKVAPSPTRGGPALVHRRCPPHAPRCPRP
jgi:hypothetical protein